MRLSVIVCTRNRCDKIAPCLDSIVRALEYAAVPDAEIVVVDNGSIDDTDSILKDWAASCPFPVSLQFEGLRGVSHARNRGMQVARGELLIWTDDDCRLDQLYIQEAIRLDSCDTELVLRGGRVVLGDLTDLPVAILPSTETQCWSRKERSARRQNLRNRALGCNMTMRRALAATVGGFDEQFGPGTVLCGSDDCDYVLRAYLAGAVVEFSPSLLVYHHHGRKSTEAGHNLIRGYLIGAGALYAKFLFTHFDFIRPFWWDLKSAVRELALGELHAETALRFNHRTVLGLYLRGGLLYYWMNFLRTFRRRKQGAAASNGFYQPDPL